jgi:hypothetical protein
MGSVRPALAAVGDHLLAVGPLSIWTAMIATLGAYLAWRGLRISHISAQTVAPHIVAKNNNWSAKCCVYFHIEGPNSGQWKVTKAAVKWPSKSKLCPMTYEVNDHGDQIEVAGPPQGRSISSPVSPLMLEFPPTSPIDLVFTISLKSDPRIKRRCAARIEAID